VAQLGAPFCATGGVSVGNFNTFMTLKEYLDDFYDASGARVGWVLGAGVEAPVSQGMILWTAGDLLWLWQQHLTLLR
jgi:opacity protein-like surface antigen